MTVQDIAAIILEADPNAEHYKATATGQDFTVWMEYERIGLMADDEYCEPGWKFEIDRYTKTELDPIADKLERVLTDAPGVTWTHRVMYDIETEYIRHVFDCEGI